MAVDYFLKIDGVDGESTDDKHKGELEVLAWSWGESQPGGHQFGGGGGVGKVSMQDFNFSVVASKASPKLMVACATGSHLKEATLTCRKAGGEQQEYLKIKLSDLLVSAFQTSGSSGDNAPVDNVSLNYSKIEWEYKPQKPDGTLDAPVKAGYDLKANKKL